MNHKREMAAYTDAPPLRPNLLIASGQLLIWLLFHPTAWQNHITCHLPGLSPQFCLTQVNRQQWRQPALWRLLLIGYFVWPLVAASLTTLGMWMLREELECSGVVYALILGTLIGLAVGIAIGAAPGMMITLSAVGLFNLTFAVPDILWIDILIQPTLGLTYGLLGGVASFVVSQTAVTQRKQPASRLFGGAVIGLFISAVIMSIVVGTVSWSVLNWEAGNLDSDLVSVVVGLFVGAAMALATSWRTGSTRWGILAGTLWSITIGLGFALLFRDVQFNTEPAGFLLLVLVHIVIEVVFTVLLILPYVLSERLAGPWSGAIASLIGSQGVHLMVWQAIDFYEVTLNLTVGMFVALLAFTTVRWRPILLYPFQAAWHTLLLQAEQRRTVDQPTLLRWHAAFWDEAQWLPLFGLDEHLALVLERHPTGEQPALNYISQGRQRWAAQAAQIELDARLLQSCTDVEAVGYIYQTLGAGELTGPASALLRSLSHISQDTAAAVRQESRYNQRLALRATADRLNALLRELTRSDEPYAVRFRPIVEKWQQLMSSAIRELDEAVEKRQEIDNPYVIGVPLTAQQEVFVGRSDISQQIENLLLDRRRPPLLLYGQRRMGKTSLLNNLGRLLPHTVLPLFVDLQGPVSFASDYAGFLYNVARNMIDSAGRQRGCALDPLPREALAADPFTRFDEWLDQVEQTTEAQGYHTLLLALDEFEALDNALAEGRYSERLILGSLRHIIQHRHRFKVLLAGSHMLDEFQRWAGYLINAQVVPIGCLKEEEACQLIERPVQEFALRYQPSATQHIYWLTNGHPFLLQLLCAGVVALKNEQPIEVRRIATVKDVEAAVSSALSRGSLFFADIERNQVDQQGREFLCWLASRKVADYPFDHRQVSEQLVLQLTKRELIEAWGGGYRFQIEMIRRWFAMSQPQQMQSKK